ncbi:ABC transporter ATP-binding protein [Rhodococcus sp. X156]|uniref:dipeptide ABC transporter ATP-binding protein n=1 Tax=Rhodococcus sp. X156 TaxID=2499145 RepID=UPI000FD845BF|nr:ABC transporter ATP-binding protein [Rhodococcus sp. X156]
MTLSAAPGHTPVSTAAEALVSVQDLHVTFQRNGSEVPSLRGVSLEIGRGEIIGLVGESGSGKSVLGLSLLGLLPTSPAPRTSGQVVVAGTDVLTATAEQRRLLRRDHLGAVFQDPMTSLNPTMRVGRQVEEKAGSAQEALRLLDAVGVPQAKSRLRAYPHELSGGLRQRVMIAMAVAGSPSLVVADEPTTALDVSVQAQILELVVNLRAELGCSFVFITHDLGVASEIADRIAVLYGGKLLEVGPTAAVLEAPRQPYTLGLLQTRLTPTSDRAHPLPTLSGEPPSPKDHPPGCPFGPRCELHVAACDEPVPLEAAAPGHLVACTQPERLDELARALASTAQWPAGPVFRQVQKEYPGVVLTEVRKAFPLAGGGTLQALDGVDLSVQPGECLALVGESGCGKSTLLRVVAGLVTPDSGDVELGRGGRPQMVFQDAGSSMTPWSTIGDLLTDRLRAEGVPRRERAAAVRSALALVGLPAEVASARARQLSGGQRQRASLARAVIVPPRVLLCDEPTSALDVSLVATVLNLLGRLRRELDMAVLFVTHDLAAARVAADRIAVMTKGRIVEEGDAEQVVDAPSHPYTRALLDAAPRPGRRRTGTLPTTKTGAA